MAWEQPELQMSASPSQALAEESARAFMSRVYRWMTLGLFVTGAVALGVASSPEVAQSLWPYRMPILLGQLGLVLALSWLSRRMGGALAAFLFLLYSAAVGVTLSTL